MTNFKLRIASRRSKLAMVQTLWVKDQLEKNDPNLRPLGKFVGKSLRE